MTRLHGLPSAISLLVVVAGGGCIGGGYGASRDDAAADDVGSDAGRRPEPERDAGRGDVGSPRAEDAAGPGAEDAGTPGAEDVGVAPVEDAGGPLPPVDAGGPPLGEDSGRPPPDPAFCVGKLNGAWCDGDDLVMCRNDGEQSRAWCEAGCQSMPVGTADQCFDVEPCREVPPMASPDPPDEACSYMDWRLSPDGFYLISTFGTTNDATTLGHSTSCGFLQGHYDGHGCRWNNRRGGCEGGGFDIPWVRGDVDYDYATVLATVDANLGGDVPAPEYFYVAGAQRYGCGALLRATNTENGRCVVVYAEDGGPGTRYEYADRGGRRILDSSPAVVRYLGVQRWGWSSSTLIQLEWGEPGDAPGQACPPCEGALAAAGSEDRRSPYDVDHMMPSSCR